MGREGSSLSWSLVKPADKQRIPAPFTISKGFSALPGVNMQFSRKPPEMPGRVQAMS